MSFLEKEEAEKSSSFWDWVVGIGIVVVIGGFTGFYQYEKRVSTKRFNEADALFQAGKLKDAGKLYEDLKSAQYITTNNDSLIYARLDSIETAQEQQNALIIEAKKAADAHDTLAVAAQLGKLNHKELLAPEDQAWADSAARTASAKP